MYKRCTIEGRKYLSKFSLTKLLNMKLYLLGVLSLMYSLTIHAQNDIIKKGSLTLSPGIGIGTAWSDYGNKIGVPPLSVSLDIGIAPNITIGPYIAYSSTTETDYFSGDYTYTHLLIGAKGAYHFDISDKFTGHAGAMRRQKPAHSYTTFLLELLIISIPKQASLRN